MIYAIDIVLGQPVPTCIIKRRRHLFLYFHADDVYIVIHCIHAHICTANNSALRTLTIMRLKFVDTSLSQRSPQSSSFLCRVLIADIAKHQTWIKMFSTFTTHWSPNRQSSTWLIEPVLFSFVSIWEYLLLCSPSIICPCSLYDHLYSVNLFS